MKNISHVFIVEGNLIIFKYKTIYVLQVDLEGLLKVWKLTENHFIDNFDGFFFFIFTLI